ncbi:unnamed protein product [Phytophthora fragariaefolia]|uniref:Unnamed protein product n=1 Tax=Phytophthora fragariaefolia TaxID=1490495 RepID=A0A9W7CKT1_9STRA|nr:unnamed protein product [Phytophthora fragariaefolia]
MRGQYSAKDLESRLRVLKRTYGRELARFPRYCFSTLTTASPQTKRFHLLTPNQAERTVRDVFSALSATDIRQRAGKTDENAGELLPTAVSSVIQMIGSVHRNDVFLDVGAGLGNVAAQFAGQTNALPCLGIEKRPVLVNRRVICFQAHTSQMLLLHKVVLHQGNVLDTPLSSKAVSAGQTQRLETTVETLSVLMRTDTGLQYRRMAQESPSTLASELTSLPAMSWKRFARDLHDGRIEQIFILSDVEKMESEAEELKQLGTECAYALSTKSKQEVEVLREYKDVLSDDIRAKLPQDKGVQHEIDLVPGTKYCVTRQWPLPREQVKAIDDFFENRRKAGQARESKSRHSAPTFCVKKAQGGWRIVYAYSKLNDATVPAQTPILRIDVIIDSMALSATFRALDLRDGFYQILMRESDIPLTAVSTRSDMLWDWLVMPQGLKNAPATFNRCVTHMLRSVRDFAPSYIDDVFIRSRAGNGKSDVEIHKEHLRELFALMRKHKLYANLKKCIFGASEIPVLG